MQINIEGAVFKILAITYLYSVNRQTSKKCFHSLAEQWKSQKRPNKHGFKPDEGAIWQDSLKYLLKYFSAFPLVVGNKSYTLTGFKAGILHYIIFRVIWAFKETAQPRHWVQLFETAQFDEKCSNHVQMSVGRWFRAESRSQCESNENETLESLYLIHFLQFYFIYVCSLLLYIMCRRETTHTVIIWFLLFSQL